LLVLNRRAYPRLTAGLFHVNHAGGSEELILWCDDLEEQEAETARLKADYPNDPRIQAEVASSRRHAAFHVRSWGWGETQADPLKGERFEYGDLRDSGYVISMKWFQVGEGSWDLELLPPNLHRRTTQICIESALCEHEEKF
jgi:hypothetical protein